MRYDSKPFWIPILSISLAFALAACNKKEDATKTDKPVTETKPETNPQPKPSTAKPAVTIATPEDMSKRMRECMGYSAAKDAAKLAGCYAENAAMHYIDFQPPMDVAGRDKIIESTKQWWKAFPDVGMEMQLVLVKDKTEFVTVSMTHGTNTGELHGMAPTNKKVGVVGASQTKVNAQGEVTEENMFLDQLTWTGQLTDSPQPHRKALEPTHKPPMVVVAKGGKTEADDVAIVKAVVDAMNARDAAKVMEHYADDATFSYMAAPADVTGKKAIQGELEQYLGMSSDVSTKPEWTWAAGEYVVQRVRSQGTNDGPMPDKKPASNKKFDVQELDIYQLNNGKIVHQWIFSNGLAFASQLGLVKPEDLMKAHGGEAGEAGAGTAGEAGKAPAKPKK